MREIKQIIAAYKSNKEKGKKSVLATVVHVEGSSYRRPSARMLVDETGQMTGAISGGCLEGDALRKALFDLDQNKNTLVTYDTSDEEDAIVGAQLGCNGIIQVLFEPIEFGDSKNPIELLELATANREKSILITLFNLRQKRGEQKGTALLINDSKKLTGDLQDQKLLDRILLDIQLVTSNHAPLFREYTNGENSINVFLEYFAPPVSFVIVGAGNDTLILSQMAELLGWKVAIVDGRPTHANPDRFSSSCQVLVSNPESILEHIDIDEQTYFALLTHNYHYDLAVLKELIRHKEIPYIGILGPKKKFERMKEDLEKDGVKLSPDLLKKIYSPIGLEIGAETPEEIGLSILAEIQAIVTGTKGTSLREKKSPIHSDHNTQFDSIKL